MNREGSYFKGVIVKGGIFYYVCVFFGVLYFYFMEFEYRGMFRGDWFWDWCMRILELLVEKEKERIFGRKFFKVGYFV